MKYTYMYMYIAFNVTEIIQWCLEYQIFSQWSQRR